MFWFPYTGSIPAEISWPALLLVKGLAVIALAGAGRVAVLACAAARRDRSVSVPVSPVPLDEGQEVKQAAA